MRLSTVSVRVERDDRVVAHYSPARTDRLSDGYELNVRPLVHVYIGDVSMFGPP